MGDLISAVDDGFERVGVDKVSSMIMGVSDYELLDASADNAEASTILRDRCIWCDVGGIIKIAYLNKKGDEVIEVITMPGAQIVQIRNVIRLYRYYVGTTAGTAKCYSSAGLAITNAVKLRR